MTSETIEALLRAVDDGDHLAGCECLRMYPRDCSCNLREITRAAAAVRAELAREPVEAEEMSDWELKEAYSKSSGRHVDGLRAVARAARGER